jgi:anti-sigma regulatory factor (Ser/Thr protein kinase)
MKRTHEFSSDPHSVAAARRLAVELLSDADAAVREAVELMVSELATNAIRHAGVGFQLTIARQRDVIRVEVTDPGGGRPTPRSPGPDEPTGRGLRIVEMLSDAWGVEPTAGRGKTVWFTMAARPAVAPAAHERRAHHQPQSHAQPGQTRYEAGDGPLERVDSGSARAEVPVVLDPLTGFRAAAQTAHLGGDIPRRATGTVGTVASGTMSVTGGAISAGVLAAYRRTGADVPFADQRRPHGTAFEGWFWRFTDPATGRVLVAMCGVNRDRGGRRWGTVGVAAHPGGIVHASMTAEAIAPVDGLSLHAADGDRRVVDADPDRLRLTLAPDTWLEAELDPVTPWPVRAFGGCGPAQMVPAFSQYWHPYVLHARTRGTACVRGQTVSLDGFDAYAEKNWGGDGFPERWWWGQAHGFDDAACVAFAGGRAGVGRLRVPATAIVAALDGEVIRLAPPTAVVRAEVTERQWRLRGASARHRVTIEGHANGTAPHLLPVPIPAARRNLEGAAAQHLAGEITVTVHRGRRLWFTGSSRLAGLEVGTLTPA